MNEGTVKIRVPQLLKESNQSATDLMYGARIASGTAYKLASEEECDKMTGISFDVLVKVCRFLDVGICDVLQIVGDSDS